MALTYPFSYLEPIMHYTRRRQWHPTPYSCLENPMDRGAWWATVYGAAELDTTEATSWETYMQVRKQQLELDMERQTVSE